LELREDFWLDLQWLITHTCTCKPGSLLLSNTPSHNMGDKDSWNKNVLLKTLFTYLTMTLYFYTLLYILLFLENNTCTFPLLTNLEVIWPPPPPVVDGNGLELPTRSLEVVAVELEVFLAPDFLPHEEEGGGGGGSPPPPPSLSLSPPRLLSPPFDPLLPIRWCSLPPPPPSLSVWRWDLDAADLLGTKLISRGSMLLIKASLYYDVAILQRRNG
jgi:hypothetical protein